MKKCSKLTLNRSFEAVQQGSTWVVQRGCSNLTITGNYLESFMLISPQKILFWDKTDEKQPNFTGILRKNVEHHFFLLFLFVSKTSFLSFFFSSKKLAWSFHQPLNGKLPTCGRPCKWKGFDSVLCNRHLMRPNFYKMFPILIHIDNPTHVCSQLQIWFPRAGFQSQVSHLYRMTLLVEHILWYFKKELGFPETSKSFIVALTHSSHWKFSVTADLLYSIKVWIENLKFSRRTFDRENNYFDPWIRSLRVQSFQKVFLSVIHLVPRTLVSP